MRTNIEIDGKLLRQAMKVAGVTTKKAAVEAAMRLTVQLKAQEGIRKLAGIGWEGDLRALRESRFLDKDGFFCQDATGKQPEDPRRGLQRNSPSRDSAAR